MGNKMSRINLRVSDDLVILLEEIRDRKGKSTVSEIVRDALDRYLDDESDSWNSGVVKVKIPLSTLEVLETLIMAGDATDISQAVNFAINDWVQTRQEYHLEGRDALRKKIGDMVEEREAKRQMKSVAEKMNER